MTVLFITVVYFRVRISLRPFTNKIRDLSLFLEPTVKITAVYDMTTCCVVDTYRRFGEAAVGLYIQEAGNDNVKSFT